MINSRSIRGATRQIWQAEAESCVFEVRIDDESGVMSLELESGTRVALDYTQIAEMVKAIEARKQQTRG